VSLLTFLVGMVTLRVVAASGGSRRADYRGELIGPGDVARNGPGDGGDHARRPVGSAFAAELGTMKVNEELNALETMGLSSVQFLVVQRVVAGILLTPVLTIFAMYAGLVGGIPSPGLGFPFGWCSSDSKSACILAILPKAFQEYRLRSGRLFR